MLTIIEVIMDSIKYKSNFHSVKNIHQLTDSLRKRYIFTISLSETLSLRISLFNY